jgi:hypothetical protein
MSLYRQTRGPSARRTTIVLVTGIAVLAAGFGLGRATAPEASLADNLASLRADASEITDALELVPLHYESTNTTTRQGARDQLARARERFADLEPDLRLLDAARAAAASRALSGLGRLVDEDAPSTEVEAAAARARDAVRAAAGMQGA